MFQNKPGIKSWKKEEGVTLIELLIVIAIVAIVATIAVAVIIPVDAGASAQAAKDTQTNLYQFVTTWANAGYGVTYIAPGDATMGVQYENTTIAYSDLNGNSTPEPGEPVIAFIAGHYTG